jgi:hypothetical protein
MLGIVSYGSLVKTRISERNICVPIVWRNLKSVTVAPSEATICPPDTPRTDGRAFISLATVGQAVKRRSFCSFVTWGMMTVM